MANDDPVFIGKRHHVGDGGEGDKAEGAHEVFTKLGRGALAVPKLLANLPGDLERDGGAAMISARSVWTFQLGVNDGIGSRELGADCVVIGDDELDAEFASEVGLLDGRRFRSRR